MKYSLFFCSVLYGLLAVLSSCQEVPVVKAELLKEMQATTGEGAIWHSDRKTLFWVDIEGKTLYEYSPERNNNREWMFDSMISTVVPESDSTVVVALQNKIVRFNLNTEEQTLVARIPTNGGKLRCNDGKCGPSGRLLVGTMVLDGKPGDASLYCVSSEGETVEMLNNKTISNGLAWSPQKRFMYYIDTPTNKVDRYRYDMSDVEILHDGVAFHIPKEYGSPDGMTVDSEGNLWIAHWGGSGVYCYNPYTGELLMKVEVPALNVTSCAFGGPDLDMLYITTARSGLTEKQLEEYPLSGSLFVCKPGVKGVEAYRFK